MQIPILISGYVELVNHRSRPLRKPCSSLDSFRRHRSWLPLAIARQGTFVRRRIPASQDDDTSGSSLTDVDLRIP